MLAKIQHESRYQLDDVHIAADWPAFPPDSCSILSIMCRFVSLGYVGMYDGLAGMVISVQCNPDADQQIVYRGIEPIQLAHIVTRPRHSIINQAFESKLRLPSTRPMNVSPTTQHPLAHQQTSLHAHAQADGFGIGWYSPENEAKPAVPGTVTSPHSQPVTPGIPGTPGELADHDKDESLPNGAQGEDGELLEEEVVQALELLKLRQHEAELENERPCVFKSISPVSPQTRWTMS